MVCIHKYIVLTEPTLGSRILKVLVPCTTNPTPETIIYRSCNQLDLSLVGYIRRDVIFISVYFIYCKCDLYNKQMLYLLIITHLIQSLNWTYQSMILK